jgi:hypothetical protein
VNEVRREQAGRNVRAIWIEWAREQPAPKPSWLTPWEELTEPEKEVDRRIGERMYEAGFREALILAETGVRLTFSTLQAEIVEDGING